MVLSSYKRAEGGNIGVFLMQSGKPDVIPMCLYCILIAIYYKTSVSNSYKLKTDV